MVIEEGGIWQRNDGTGRCGRIVAFSKADMAGEFVTDMDMEVGRRRWLRWWRSFTYQVGSARGVGRQKINFPLINLAPTNYQTAF